MDNPRLTPEELSHHWASGSENLREGDKGLFCLEGKRGVLSQRRLNVAPASLRLGSIYLISKHERHETALW